MSKKQRIGLGESPGVSSQMNVKGGDFDVEKHTNWKSHGGNDAARS